MVDGARLTVRIAMVLVSFTGFGGSARAQVPDWANRLPGRVAAADITTNGARGDGVSGDETAASCAIFRLRPKNVRQYFAVVGVVDARACHHGLEMSRCHAKGVVRFPTANAARWSIDRERRGLVVLRDGKAVCLTCLRCTARLFEPVYDPERGSFARPR